jgi:hypothetical protein
MRVATVAGDMGHMQWERLLWSYSAALDEQRLSLTALEAGVLVDVTPIVPGAFEPPADMPPMPVDLQDWARQLLAETTGLVNVASDLAIRVQSGRPAAMAHATAHPTAHPTALRASALDTVL